MLAPRIPLFTPRPSWVEKTKTAYAWGQRLQAAHIQYTVGIRHGSSDPWQVLPIASGSVTVVTAVSPSLHMPFLDINLENETLTHGLCSDLLPRSTCIYTYTCAVISVTWGWINWVLFKCVYVCELDGGGVVYVLSPDLATAEFGRHCSITGGRKMTILT